MCGWGEGEGRDAVKFPKHAACGCGVCPRMSRARAAKDGSLKRDAGMSVGF